MSRRRGSKDNWRKNVPYSYGSTAQELLYGKPRSACDVMRSRRKVLDLLHDNISTAIFRFWLWLCKNFSTYTLYMLQNFSLALPKIWKFRCENYRAVGLFYFYEVRKNTRAKKRIGKPPALLLAKVRSSAKKRHYKNAFLRFATKGLSSPRAK